MKNLPIQLARPASAQLSTLGSLALGVVVLAALVGPARAWTPESQQVIAEQGARLAPPDLYRQIVRNRESYFVGVMDPFRTPLADHAKNPDGSGRLDAAIEQAVDNTVRSIELHRPFNEVCYRLGVVAHYLADANDPLQTDTSDPHEASYADDFRRYLERTLPRLSVVFYGFRPGYRGRRDLPALIADSLRRTRANYPFVGREYRRIGYGSGVRTFDDRSTAYAVASLSLSHAVSDIAEVFRGIWIEAGGIDSRPVVPIRGRDQVYVIPTSPDPPAR